MSRGQIRVGPVEPAYLPDGCLHADRLLANLDAGVTEAQHEGYDGLRVCGDLSAADPRLLGGEALVEYESRANALWVSRDIIGLCHYNPHALGRDVWRRLLSVHPSSMSASDGDPVARLRCRRTSAGVRLTGEVDLTNRDALPSLLTVAVEIPGPCRIDATGLGFADVRAVAALLSVAAERAGRRTEIRCREPLATLLTLLGAALVTGLTLDVKASR